MQCDNRCGRTALARCSRCKHAAYCGRVCQREAWAEHVLACRSSEAVVAVGLDTSDAARPAAPAKKLRRQDSFIDDSELTSDSDDSGSGSGSDSDAESGGDRSIHSSDESASDTESDLDDPTMPHWRDRALDRESARQRELTRAGETSYDAFARLIKLARAGDAYETTYGSRTFLPRVSAFLDTFGQSGSVAASDRQLRLRAAAESGVLRARRSEVATVRRCAACGLSNKPCTSNVRLSADEWQPLGADCLLKVRALRELYEGVRQGASERETDSLLQGLDEARDRFFDQVKRKRYGRRRANDSD